MSWTRISGGEYARKFRGNVLRVTNIGRAWAWTTTGLKLKESGDCCTLHQAKRAAERAVREQL